MFRFFESLIQGSRTPDATIASSEGPPKRLLAFYWHFVRQTRWLYLAMFATGLGVALSDMLVPLFIGRLVGLMTAADPHAVLADSRTMLIAMAVALLIVRPGIQMLDSLVRNSAVAPGVTALIRWQNHWHVVRQSWPFFQNDFAGRIANRVMQTGVSLRESVVASIRAVWHICVYGISALVLLAAMDWRLAMPIVGWIAGYGVFLRYFVPRMRRLGKAASEARSMLMGRVVDSYTNILTVKLFARPQDEDRHVAEAVDGTQRAVANHMRLITLFTSTLSAMNALLIVGTALTGLALWVNGAIEAAAVATAIPLTWQISNMAGWVSWEVAGIFENIGVVQEGMETIAQPHALVDRAGAQPLAVTRGRIEFERVGFGYQPQRPIFSELSLRVEPGERVGIVGRSGAGKSTLVNLLLRFHDLQSGRILIDGQDVSGVTQQSLRAAIGVVTQDTSLLHRSIAENIRYGRPSATDDEVRAAASQAHADEFIEHLSDWQGRRGYDAQVGERGVKLSGGQRQRIALARVLLKNAPILVLDEATSALDSEVEAVIQEQLQTLMAGKTVIAIAHRLSTIASMDRLIVMDQGRVVEQGTHAQLLALDGHYARLWNRQSGGFLDH
ncbi:MAG: ABC transporter ATP-binding protein [Burkholderiaceae bacterium]